MRKIVFLAVVLVGLTAVTTASVSYEIDVDGDTAQINASFDLYTSDRANYFSTRWRVGEDARVQRVRDGVGKIEQDDSGDPGTYSREGDRVKIHSNSGDARESTAIEIRYTVPIEKDVWHDGLHVLDMQLSGFRDQYEEYDEENTFVQVTVKEDIVGVSQSFGFESSYDGRTGTFQGEGPVNIRLTYTDREGEYDNFILFGDANLSAADDAYPLAKLVTGRDIEYRKLPVIILEDDAYTDHLDRWSAGRYRRGGLIFIRDDRIDDEGFTGLVMHEVMHAFNEDVMRWVSTDSGMFDEGTAKYVEFLTNENRGVRQAEIFGETVEWRGPCSDDEDSECRYSLEPRGTADDLWQYYNEDMAFMEGWNPGRAGLFREGLTRRTFGYAYSELLIRDFLRRNDPLELHDVYDQLAAIEEEAETPEEYQEKLSSAMGDDLNPCEDLSKNAVERCLDAVHDYVPDVPDDVEIDGQQEEITFHKVEVPDAASRSEGGNQSLTITRNGDLPDKRSFLSSLLDQLRQAATTFINELGKLLR